MTKRGPGKLKFLFVIAPSDLRKKDSEGWFCEQIEPFIRQLRADGHEVVISFSPNFGGIKLSRKEFIYDPRPRALFEFFAGQTKSAIGLLRSKNRDSPIIKRLRSDWFEARLRSIKRIVQRENPDLICGVNLSKTELNAANDLGIKSVEFQHAHFYADAFLRQFPSLKPDYFAYWFDWDRDAIGSSGSDPIFVGLPYGSPERVNRSASNENVLLVALQYNQKNLIDSFGFVSTDLDQFLSFDWKAFGLTPIARFHPACSWWKQILASLQLQRKFQSVIFSSSRSRNLDYFLDRAVAVLTVESSIWIDSISRGIPYFSTRPLSSTSRLPKELGSLVAGAGSPSDIANKLMEISHDVAAQPRQPKASVALLVEKLTSHGMR